MRALLLAYGLVNAVLFSGLLPLWEGFDETFHYGYVQMLSTQAAFPVLGRTAVSEEIWRSLELAPVSHFIQPSTRAPANFNDWFALSAEQRRARRASLETLPANLKYEPHPALPNYEVNQAPLIYVLMAIPDRLLSGFAVTTRVLILRLLCSLITVLLTFWATLTLARRLNTPPTYAHAALFCVFSSEMYYATICHVSNDWLAIPLFTLIICAALRGSVPLLALVFSLALLTKAYFLVLAPYVIGVILWRAWKLRSPRSATLAAAMIVVAAGPWYARNVVLYHNLSATVESTSGVGGRQILGALVTLPWRESIIYMARSSLWTGNNSFTTFSLRTLDIMLLLLAASFACYLYRVRRPEAHVLAPILLFSGGLLYISAAFFYSTHGGAIAAVPWYMQVLLPPILLLAFLGLSRVRFGRYLAGATVLLWAYVLMATYIAKLIPLYGGYQPTHAHLGALLSWYLNDPRRSEILSTTCLLPPTVLYLLLSCTVVIGCIQAARLIRKMPYNR
jgi:hypothetical protein